jgi:MFS family permease
MSTALNAPLIRPRTFDRHGIAFWAVAFSLLVALAYNAVPTPLYPLYQARDGFSSLTITIIFAAYAVGVVVSLFTVGHLSDLHGRRRLTLIGLSLALTSALVFLFWRDLPGLLTGRFIGGLGVGTLAATATAWIAELHAFSRPGHPSRRAEVVATAANLGGIGLGPLVAGALAEWVDYPLTVPFVVFLGAILLALGLVLASPETKTPVYPRPAYRPQRVSVPSQHLAAYVAAAVTAAISFATFGLFSSLAPSFLVGTFDQSSPLLAGATAFAVFASGAAGQVFVAARPIRTAVAIGATTTLLGIAVLVVAVWLPDPSLALFLVGGALSGAGSGCLFKGVMSQAAWMAPPSNRAETLAGMFLAGYVGISLPAVGLGVLTQYVEAKTALLVFGTALATTMLAATRFVLRGAQRIESGAPTPS